MPNLQRFLSSSPLAATSFCSGSITSASVFKVQSRGVRYKNSGGMIGGRRKRIPLNWRDLNFNPARLPSAWKPPDWDKKQEIDYEREKELAKYTPGYKPAIPSHEKDDYHKEPVYFINSSLPFSEGLKQALFVTKSVIADSGLPKQIHNLAESVSYTEQDQRAIQVIRHAHLFDVDPRSLDKENKVQRWKADNYRIVAKPDRYCPLIMKELIRLCETRSFQLSESFRNRIVIEGPRSIACFRRDCSSLDTEFLPVQDTSWNIRFDLCADMQIHSKDPLSAFADSNAVLATKDISLAPIYPIMPIADLKSTHNYDFVTNSGFSSKFSRPHLHTIALFNTDQLPPNLIYGKMLTHLFTLLYSKALETYGDNPQDLSSPLSAQCVASDGRVFQFMCMQLNTTKLNSDDGIKNMVWVDNEYVKEELYQTDDGMTSAAMYEECGHTTWKSPEYYTGYNPDVFKLFQGFWLNGVL
ncbi:unnamed protein product [Clavelina lepadiformis]|uniref:Large ribosomal subunit protein mL37 n=1 Tax=Clavelina lepadiformis TaxID=159417 RepID=A0ABP0FNL3_CLALP